MHWFNRTKIIGRHRIPDCRNLLIIANHLTMIDSWFIVMACCWPRCIIKPYLVPWHLPEEKNFFKNWLMARACRMWRCIPITRGSGNFLAKLPEISRQLTAGRVMIFPEGTRNRQPKSGQLCRWTPGAARLAHQTKATVLPVAIRGVEEVLPIGSTWPKFGKTIIVVIGEPIQDELSYYYRQQAKKANIEVIAEIMRLRLQRLLTLTSHWFERQKA
ncbi:MAG: hypothetical protein A3A24_00260 [Candidatus Buchananbacteria bacterium RIFCSPLOWO2_01_FULL_46_12]|nr:MAG: hypothetical protein A3A24_00260 [Candidatus Buchananbacteria bacterium RIFCSPLOWO2_01_FULL_46_12]